MAAEIDRNTLAVSLPCRRNFKDNNKITFPHGGKTGHFALIGGELYTSLQGFVVGDDDWATFVKQAVDQLVEVRGCAW